MIAVDNMKVHYIVLVDGTELMAKTTGADWFGSVRLWDACVMVMDEYTYSPPLIRKWLPFTEDPDQPIKLTPSSITTYFAINSEMSDWYKDSLESINNRTEKLKGQLDMINSSKTSEDYDEETNEPELDEFLSEFMTRDMKGTIH